MQEAAGEFDIGPLRDAAEAALVEGLIYAEWARFEASETWQANRRDIHASLDPGVRLPKFFAARAAGELAGIASLVARDLPIRAELGPWLANVLVLPGWRRRGLGTALARTAMAHGMALAPALFLYTHDQEAMYRRLGWEVIECAVYLGKPITIMRFPAVPAAA